MQCEVEYRTTDWPFTKRCPDEAIKRITISTGELDKAVVVWEGAVCETHDLEAQDDIGVHVLSEPLEIAHKPEHN